MSKKHSSELPDEILISLGFFKMESPYGDKGDQTWTHEKSCGTMYHHILTPEQTAIALIEIGHQEFRRRAIAEIASIDMD